MARGLLRLVALTASAEVFVEGLADPVRGELVGLANDELTIVTSDADADDAHAGSIMAVPTARIISVQARCIRIDQAAEDRQRIEGDEELLARARELATAHAPRLRQIGRKLIRRPVQREVSAELADVPPRDVAIALTLRFDWGEVHVPPIDEHETSERQATGLRC